MHYFSTKLGKFVEGTPPGIEGHPPAAKISAPAPAPAVAASTDTPKGPHGFRPGLKAIWEKLGIATGEVLFGGDR